MELDYVKLKEIKPALSGYIRDAQSLLKQSPFPDDKDVHDIRVLMKKSRAVLNLLISQTDEESYTRDYNAFREVGRVTRYWRESSVHRKTLRDLRKDHPDIFTALGENEKLESLIKKPDLKEGTSADSGNELVHIEELLNKAGFRIRFRSMSTLDPRILLTELDKTYHTVTDKYLICRNNQKPENIHTLRKRAKDFLYQLYFFRPLNPGVIKSLEKRLETMTQYLGKFNDLAQLINALEYKYRGPDGNPALDELIVIIRDEQDKYLSKVWPVAYQIFCPGQKLVNVLGFKLLMI
ncbi:MAG: CHAD domain-containing protein [Bacteroidales bacterium]|jgi:CHAD domain-containing protein